MTHGNKKPSDGKIADGKAEKWQTREELIADLMKLPPERRANIIKVVQILVAERRLERAIKDGTARRN